MKLLRHITSENLFLNVGKNDSFGWVPVAKATRMTEEEAERLLTYPHIFGAVLVEEPEKPVDKVIHDEAKLPQRPEEIVAEVERLREQIMRDVAITGNAFVRADPRTGTMERINPYASSPNEYRGIDAGRWADAMRAVTGQGTAVSAMFAQQEAMRQQAEEWSMRFHQENQEANLPTWAQPILASARRVWPNARLHVTYDGPMKVSTISLWVGDAVSAYRVSDAQLANQVLAVEDITRRIITEMANHLASTRTGGDRPR